MSSSYLSVYPSADITRLMPVDSLCAVECIEVSVYQSDEGDRDQEDAK